MRILLIGGSGRLGTELQRIDAAIVAPSHREVDVSDEASVLAGIDKYLPDIVLHAAAVTDNLAVVADPTDAIRVNIQGTAHLALACLKRRLRLVYLSTDYVYPGERGNYREIDEIKPCNPYAWSKLGGEASVTLVPNHLIIRTSFGPSKFAYPVAFEDKWTSKDYVDQIAPMVLEAALSPITGVLNIGTERKTLFDYAKKRNPEVKPLRLGNSAFATPQDTSMNTERWRHFQSQEPLARSVHQCRVCDSKRLEVYLDLGLMPLANNLNHTAQDARAAQRFPMQIMICKDCYLSQLSVVVDPKVLFSYYTYRSGVSPSFAKHCRRMAQSLKEILRLGPSDVVVDIAGNDGTLLNQFREEAGCEVVNVEPAENIAAISRSAGIATINEFWSQSVAARIVAEHKAPKLITATNVFAHVDDMKGFLLAAKSCLDPGGVIMIEFPYLADLIAKSEFDTVYFEHLSYVPVGPVETLVAKLGMSLWRVEKQDIHGGSVRVFIRPNTEIKAEASVAEFIAEERKLGLMEATTYHKWADGIYGYVGNLNANLSKLRRGGAKIAAFGASAKGNTLLNSCRLTTETISYIVDDTPEKIGKFSPGTGIPIVNRSALVRDRPDYLLVLAWNFLDDIMASTEEFSRAGGKYIIPIPEFRVIEGRLKDPSR